MHKMKCYIYSLKNGPLAMCSYRPDCKIHCKVNKEALEQSCTAKCYPWHREKLTLKMCKAAMTQLVT